MFIANGSDVAEVEEADEDGTLGWIDGCCWAASGEEFDWLTVELFGVVVERLTAKSVV